MLTRRHVIASLLVGAVGCLFIWTAAPYNNFFLRNSFISDTYFPEAAVIFLLLLVLGVNPLLSLVRRPWVLNRRQLMLVIAMLLGAAVLPSTGLLRMLPWSLAQSTQDISRSERLATALAESGVPEVLFPDAVGYDIEVPASRQLLEQLDPGAAIPWANWGPVALIWGVFLLSCWLVMIGTGLVLFPEWREHERLPFPLLGVFRSLLPESGSGRVLPAIFRDRLFWAGAGTVMLLYALNGLNHHTGGRVPGFPMGWKLSPILSEEPWRYLHWSIKNVEHIYFILVGMAFFMPNRVGFSIWFTTIAYGVFEMLRLAYMPTSYGGMVEDHRNGALMAMSLGILYLSRRHWRRVGGLLFRRVTSDADRLLKVAGWMLVAGATGMFVWLTWAGVPVWWSLIFVLLGFMVSLVIARIVAETGMPFVRITGLDPHYFMVMLPAGWLSGAAIYMAGFISMIFHIGSRVSAAVMVSQAAGLDEQASPRHQLRLGYLMIAILVVGFAVCGAIHLDMGYTFATSIDGVSSPLSQFGSTQMRGAQNQLVNWSSGYWPGREHRLGSLGVGIGLAGALQVACMMMPKWPLHPIGMLLVGHFYGQMAWASILIGWVLKVLIINYGGAIAYRRASPLFLGLILGHVFSAVIWTLVPVILMLLGHDPAKVGCIHLFPS